MDPILIVLAIVVFWFGISVIALSLGGRRTSSMIVDVLFMPFIIILEIIGSIFD